jgi:hypothetical protein
MAWTGRTKTKAQIGGRHGGEVRVGDHYVPRHVVMQGEGEDGHPDIELRFEVRDGRPTCVGLEIRAKADGRGVRAADLQMFNLDVLTADAFTEFATPVEAGDRSAEGGVTAWGLDRREAEAANREFQRAMTGRRVSRAELERVAETYRRHRESSPTRAVMEVLGYGSESTAARRVKQAEEAGLLTPTSPGKRRS